MSDEELEQEASALYAAYAAERGPAWHQLSEVTKTVWYGCVLAGVELPHTSARAGTEGLSDIALAVRRIVGVM